MNSILGDRISAGDKVHSQFLYFPLQDLHNTPRVIALSVSRQQMVWGGGGVGVSFRSPSKFPFLIIREPYETVDQPIYMHIINKDNGTDSFDKHI